MPIFEYDCKACGVTFETLVRNSTRAAGAVVAAEKVACPRCNSRKIKRRVSTCAHAVAGGSSTPKSAGASCGGNCSGCKGGCGHSH